MNQNTLLVFSDIDGTLYTHPKQIHADIFVDVAFAQRHGVEFIFCTGNPYFLPMNTLAKSFNCNYLICSNGSQIVDIKNNKVIYHDTLPFEIASKIAKKCNEVGISCDWWDDKSLYCNELAFPRVKQYVDNYSEWPLPLEVAQEVTGDVCKIEFYCHKDEIEKMIPLDELLANYDLHVAKMKPYFYEVTSKTTSKGHAIKMFCKMFDHKIENTMGIGDSPNDHTMFEVVEHSYAMANADEVTKTKAKHHTCSVEQNGLGYAVKDFMFRKGIRE